jgi:hypothetical protein
MDRLTIGRSAQRVPELVSHWRESTPQASAVSDAACTLTFREIDRAAQSALGSSGKTHEAALIEQAVQLPS